MIARWRNVARRRGLAAAAAFGCLAVAVEPRAAEPGPLPLLRDAADVPADAASPPPGTPAGLGDWRLVAALGATFAVLVGARMFSGRRMPPPPPDVFEVLGTAALGGQHTVRIVRFGPKTLLVGVSAAGATTLAEIADPQSTACIAAACRGVPRPSRSSQTVVPTAAAPVRAPATREVA